MQPWANHQQFSITDFRKKITGVNYLSKFFFDFAELRTNNWVGPEVRISEIINEKNKEILENLFFYSENITIPLRGINTDPHIYANGFRFEAPTGSNYGDGDINITMNVDLDFRLYQFFMDWMNLVHDKNTGYFSFHNRYTTDVSIYQLKNIDQFFPDQMNFTDMIELNPYPGFWALKVDLKNVYPKSVSAIEFKHDAKDERTKITVNFTYEQIHYNYPERMTGSLKPKRIEPPKLKDRFGQDQSPNQNAVAQRIGIEQQQALSPNADFIENQPLQISTDQTNYNYSGISNHIDVKEYYADAQRHRELGEEIGLENLHSLSKNTFDTFDSVQTQYNTVFANNVALEEFYNGFFDNENGLSQLQLAAILTVESTANDPTSDPPSIEIDASGNITNMKDILAHNRVYPAEIPASYSYDDIGEEVSKLIDTSVVSLIGKQNIIQPELQDERIIEQHERSKELRNLAIEKVNGLKEQFGIDSFDTERPAIPQSESSQDLVTLNQHVNTIINYINNTNEDGLDANNNPIALDNASHLSWLIHEIQRLRPASGQDIESILGER